MNARAPLMFIVDADAVIIQIRVSKTGDSLGIPDDIIDGSYFKN